MLRHRRATKLRTDLIYKNEPNGDINKKGTQALWDLLIDEAEALAKDAPQNGIHVMEVGMHRPKECLRAANHGLNAHCIEPSPISNSRILLGFDKRLPMLTRAGSGLKVSRWVGRYRTVA